ncbi:MULTISPECIES: FAD-dependent oxidoreductase [Metallosphaera]|uniref:NADPH:sulfur oxidoreductase n=3 Tax=Metallosphaera TaxID=41980 RepID=A4YIG8_METS5|nr:MULTISPECIES: FAD-dependent oxidoreductase [Metallosphaera]ABP96220.1 NADPH:sulfur oxidoreductase [Metallosphaera sedula DSM 5348]AIM28203.1 NADPH:sulfur oxidoreductase [Metallosphaera sedula]AKV75016.1 CoA-disulfide reductase [Metallosphaera sedula]AKV77254.1 CoA-disulfide reductase [Metallosphaera sedula]AKV79504.1 CoA-disulfide reductase [Metallosphaera sedula]
MPESLVVLGGGAAGMSAASRARRLRPDLRITVIESTKMVSHAPCGIPYFVEGLFDDENLFMTYTPSYFERERKIEVLTNTVAKEVDLDSRVVRTDNGKALEYDWLVVSLGALPKTLPNVKGNRVYYVHHPAHAVEIRERLWSMNKIAVIGGGILGVEMAEALSAVGKKVVLIHRGPYILNKMLDQDLGDVVTKLVQGKVELHLNESTEEIGENYVKTDKGKYQVDGVVLALGVTPNVAMFKEKLQLGTTGAIKTNSRMETSVKGVYAAGDVAETTHVVSRREVWMPFAPVANKMGFVAGSNIGGKVTEFPGTVGNMITKFQDMFIGKVGLNEIEAKEVGFRPISATIKSKTRARYYPGAKDIYVKLVADEDSKRILGGQIVGGEEVLGRLDSVSVALMKQLTVEEMFFAEMGYLPAISQVWDPLTVAARQLLKA